VTRLSEYRIDFVSCTLVLCRNEIVLTVKIKPEFCAGMGKRVEREEFLKQHVRTAPL
jgi:hypothetical protein